MRNQAVLRPLRPAAIRTGVPKISYHAYALGDGTRGLTGDAVARNREEGERYWRQDYGVVAPDGESATDFWDAKCYATFRVHSIFRECWRKYQNWDKEKTFHLVLYSRKDKDVGDLVVLRADDYAKLLDELDAWHPSPKKAGH